MSGRAIAAGYNAFLREARELAAFFSGKNWTADKEHDPGLTQLEILANALALACERYDQALAGEGLFVESGEPGPEHIDGVFSLEDTAPPETKFFAAQPAGREELCRDMESLSGLRRAWIVRRDGEHEPEMLVEFAPVLDARAKAFALNAQSLDAPHGLERKRSILEEASARCRRLRGVGQPALGVREIRLAPLEADISVALPDVPDRENIPALAAELLLAAEGYLRPRGEPRRMAVRREMNARLSAKLAEKGMPGASVTIRPLSFGGDANEQSGPSLAREEDAFVFIPRHIRIFSGTALIEITPEEMRRADYLAQLARIAEKRPPAEEARDMPRFTAHMQEPKLHEQFPEAYRLTDENIADPVRRGEARQLQGWLLLFEQLLADALHLLENPPALFAPHAAKPETWFAVEGGALQSLLTDRATYTAGMLEAAGQGGFAARCRAMLLHLAALQGEEAWFSREQFAAGGVDDAVWPELLACWLRHLPWLNGCRLGAERHGSGRLPERLSGASPLETRLSMLLLPFKGYTPLAARHYFDIRPALNEVTGQTEYRCYIRDDAHRLRIISLIAGRSPEEAARSGMMALSFARLPEHYHRTPTGIRIGWFAALAEEGDTASDTVRIRETAAWAGSLLPPWVRVLEHPALGAARPFEILILLEEEVVPHEWRADLRERIDAHVPAHLLPHVAFLSPQKLTRAEELLQAATLTDRQSVVLAGSELARFCEEAIAEAADV